MNSPLILPRTPISATTPDDRTNFVEWVEPTRRASWLVALVRLVLSSIRPSRPVVGVLVLLAAATASAQDAPKPGTPAPTPAPKEAPQDTKPAPVVLDPATVAKLREITFDAAREGDVKTLEEYFKTGQPAEITNNRGDSLLILACYHGHDDAVRVILEQPKTPIDARNKMGFTALTGASYKGYVGIVKQLAAKKADLNSANEKGQTALMYAAMFGRTEVVKFLVEQKADIRARDSGGKTALDLARSQGAADAAKVLEAAMQPKPPVE